MVSDMTYPVYHIFYFFDALDLWFLRSYSLVNNFACLAFALLLGLRRVGNRVKGVYHLRGCWVFIRLIGLMNTLHVEHSDVMTTMFETLYGTASDEHDSKSWITAQN
jgi:hypothetical protein